MLSVGKIESLEFRAAFHSVGTEVRLADFGLQCINSAEEAVGGWSLFDLWQAELPASDLNL